MSRPERVPSEEVEYAFVGVTGLLGTGKGTVISMLTDLASGRGIRVSHYSLSNEVRDVLGDFAAGTCNQNYLSIELVQRLKNDLGRGELFRRENLISVANELRKGLGCGVLAQRVVAKVSQRLSSETDPRLLVVIDSIRNPGEVLEFRSSWGERFRLIGIEAPSNAADSRIRYRRRPDEDSHTLSNSASLAQLRQRDRGIGEPPYGLQVDACLRMADWRIRNDNSLAELRESVRGFARQFVFSELGVDSGGLDDRIGCR